MVWSIVRSVNASVEANQLCVAQDSRTAGSPLAKTLADLVCSDMWPCCAITLCGLWVINDRQLRSRPGTSQFHSLGRVFQNVLTSKEIIHRLDFYI